MLRAVLILVCVVDLVARNGGGWIDAADILVLLVAIKDRALWKGGDAGDQQNNSKTIEGYGNRRA